MRLVLQMFPITVRYKPGKELCLADALSSLPCKRELVDETVQFQVNSVSSLPVSDQQLLSMKAETEKNTLMTELCSYASTEWPQSKQHLQEILKPFWSFRDELHVEDGLLLRNNKLVIPPAKRREVLGLLHAADCGEDKMKARA